MCGQLQRTMCSKYKSYVFTDDDVINCPFRFAFFLLLGSGNQKPIKKNLAWIFKRRLVFTDSMEISYVSSS